jgi:O-antigen ligase
MQVGRRTYYANIALWSIALAGLAYALYGIVVQLEGSNTILWFPKWSYKDSLTSTFVNRNHFAIYAGLSILCTLALIANEARKATEASIATRSGFIQFLDNMTLQIVVLAITFMVLATALLLTQSRAGAMMTVIAIIAFLTVLATTSAFAAKSTIRFGLVILIAGGVFGVISGSLLMSRIVYVAENMSERMTVYKTTLQAIGDRPLLGFGLGSFPSVYPSYRGTEFSPNDATYDYAHNIYLQLAMESGLVGTVLLLLNIILITAVCVWGARQRHRNGFFAALGVAATVLVGGHGLLDFSLQIPAIAATYCLILGVAYAQAWSTGPLER